MSLRCPFPTVLLSSNFASKWGEGANRLTAAVVGRRADTLALADLYAGLGVVGCGGTHALLDLAGHGQESLLDVAGVLCRGLEEGNTQAVGEFLDMTLDTDPTCLGSM